MKKTIKLAVAAAMAMGATSAFATNGDSLIGLGAKSRGMAGVGIGMSHGAESGLSNPALIKGSEVTFGGTVFMPSVEAKNETQGMPTDTAESDADLSVIPEVAVSVEVNENFTWGIGMYGVAGMGVDYRDTDDQITYGTLNPANQSQQNPLGFTPSTDERNYFGTKSGTNQMLTNLQLMRFAVPLAYRNSGFSIAISPILQYGSLSIAYNAGQAFADSTNTYHNTMTGRGVSQDFGFGYNVGLGYEMNGLTIGAVYTSAIDMEYKNQISKATQQFGLKGGRGLSDNLEQPAEYGVGISYETNGHTIALDYKNIAWSSAKGYEDFKWDDQNVIAVGYQYSTDKWAFRLGYNYASNPIKEQTAASMATDYDGAVINYFNAMGFPATVESHYALGASYQITKTMGIDFAYTYAPEVTETYDTSALTQAQTYGAARQGGYNQAQAGQLAAAMKSSATVKHHQQGVSLAMTIKF